MARFRISPVIMVKLKELLFIIILWNIWTYIFIFFFYMSNGHNLAKLLEHSKALSILLQNMDGAGMAATIMGFLNGTFQIFVVPRRYKHVHVSKLILIQLIVFVLSISIATILSLYIYQYYYHKTSFLENIGMIKKYILSSTYLNIFAVGFVISSVVDMMRFIRNKMGSKIFLSILLGRYYNPKEEDRIFLFIDLKSSVEIAENLNSTIYSKYLQDCFKDLEESIIRYKGQIYQYVGDECVITWKIKKSTDFNFPLRLFYDYKNKLISREAYYLKQYGNIPAFKGAIHSGVVSTVEIGSNVKSEIAFHGDVVNTTARVMELCKTFGEDLLITEEILQRTKLVDQEFQIKLKEELTLRGKHIKQKIFAVREWKD